MVLTGTHDTFAGTRIIAHEPAVITQATPRSARVPAWKVALALVLHLLAAFAYMVIGAI